MDKLKNKCKKELINKGIYFKLIPTTAILPVIR